VGLLAEAPGLALLILVVAAPVLLHAFLGARQTRGGQPGQTLGAAAGFLGTVGIILAVLLSAFAAFVAICLPVGFFGFVLGFEQRDPGKESLGMLLMVAAWPLAILAAIFVAVRVARLLSRGMALLLPCPFLDCGDLTPIFSIFCLHKNKTKRRQSAAVQNKAMLWTYPALMAAAVGTGILVSRQTQRPLPLRRWQRLGLVLGVFCGGMLGAKLPFVLADWDGLVSGRAWLESGKTLVFGLVGGYFGVEIAKWVMDIRLRTGDSFAAPVAAAVAVGRLACFSAGCCFGTVTALPWGVDFGDGQARHPTQLYECVFHLSAALLLILLQRRGLCRGQLVKLYILAYLVYRFFTEFIRPEVRLTVGLTLYQLACLALIPLFVLLWARSRESFSGRPDQSLLPAKLGMGPPSRHDNW
jgi:phosphatidylglycerol:prolipoprotein diacylglycerol transferase